MRFDSIPHYFSEKSPTQHTLAHIPDGSTEELSHNIALPRETTRFSLRSFGVVLASCLAYFSNQYSISVIAIHLYAIGEVFNDYKQVVWFVNGASLSVLLLGPIIAVEQRPSYYATVKTRKWFILSGLMAGMAGQLIAGLAQGMHILIIGQALVGITLATQPLLVTIPAELLPQSNRRLAQMLSNIAGGLSKRQDSGEFAGPLSAVCSRYFIAILQTNSLAGDIFAWQWIFRLAVIFYGSTFILLAIMYQARPLDICVEARQTKPSFDWAGTFLVSAAIILLVTGTSIGTE
ncbi:hypothetical protein Clacol_009046 [Clathrus columnatus]|uniref:Major facilitator superfamily (MFS) profile domain-containing protein n=1 Tax=Clathrus columnatus TaxID=1419009 RepID=A0AAV5AMP1_9AGAM|nr:hypothetical protein Clacol_009046 [Clathrus columnatus]